MKENIYLCYLEHNIIKPVYNKTNLEILASKEKIFFIEEYDEKGNLLNKGITDIFLNHKRFIKKRYEIQKLFYKSDKSKYTDGSLIFDEFCKKNDLYCSITIRSVAQQLLENQGYIDVVIYIFDDKKEVIHVS